MKRSVAMMACVLSGAYGTWQFQPGYGRDRSKGSFCNSDRFKIIRC